MAALPVTCRLYLARFVLGALTAVVAAGATAGCSSQQQTEIALDLPAEVQRGLMLKWQKVPGADGYRMVFKRMTGAAVCTLMVEASKEPFYVIVRDSLPPGLAHGWQLDMEMHAMKKGQPMLATGVRPLRIP